MAFTVEDFRRIPGRCQVILFRHGETVWNVQRRLQGTTDTVLSEVGIQQSRDKAKWLKPLLEGSEGPLVDEFFSSPLQRAYATALSIKEICGITCPVKRLPGLKEWNAGNLEGRVWSEIDQAEFNRGLDYNYGTGESKRERYCRIVETVKQLGKENVGKRIIAVTHGAVLGDLITQALGYGPEYSVRPIRPNLACVMLSYNPKTDRLNLGKYDGGEPKLVLNVAAQKHPSIVLRLDEMAEETGWKSAATASGCAASGSKIDVDAGEP